MDPDPAEKTMSSPFFPQTIHPSQFSGIYDTVLLFVLLLKSFNIAGFSKPPLKIA